MSTRRGNNQGHLRKRGKYWYLSYHDTNGRQTQFSLKVASRKEAARIARGFMARLRAEKELNHEYAPAHAAYLESDDPLSGHSEVDPRWAPQSADEMENEDLIFERLMHEHEDEEREKALEFNPSFDDLWTKYEAWSKDGNRSKNTVMAYRTAHRAAKKYLNPSRMADFTPAKLTEFYERGKKDGLSKSGITSYVRFLQGMYATAIKEGWFKGENPFHSTRDNKRDSVVRFLSKEDAQKLLAAAKELDKVTYLFIAIALHTGMRKDEVANLRYEEIDFDRKVITLQAKKADPKRRIQEFQLKSKLARSIPLKTELAEILAPYRKAEGYVILPTTGENVSRFRWRMPRAFAKAQKESGVKANPHLFRHTFASWAALEGISIFKISKWLGHASVQLTSDVYAHLQAHDADIDRF